MHLHSKNSMVSSKSSPSEEKAWIEKQQQKSLLRFITCGSVDDGKSSLIGRLLYDSKSLFEDQISTLKNDSRKNSKIKQEIDFALLVDGLEAEREQGITIDVAYRFFSTQKRKFIVADTPGHDQYTRNMVTGASTAELAVLLVDARKGLLTQTCRHAFICHLLGVKNIVLAINKMDTVNYEQEIFEKIVTDFNEFNGKLGISNLTPIPLSALQGDNVVERSNLTPWFDGPSLLEHLEKVQVNTVRDVKLPFQMSVQLVSRLGDSFRGFAGTINQGNIRPGDPIQVLPSGKQSRVERIVTFDGDLKFAEAGQAVTLTLKDELDCSRGDVITSNDSALELSNQFQVKIVWMDESPLLPGRAYRIKIGTQTALATISKPKYEIDINTLAHIAPKNLSLNSILVTTLIIDRPIIFTNYINSPDFGGFILIDKTNNNTVAAGLIDFALHRAQNIHWQKTAVSRQLRAEIKNQKPLVLWMTGISGSGKSTIANALEKKLVYQGYHTCLLDGDNIRHGINKDLGFKDADRIENIRRVGEVSRLMTDAGLIVITAFISPFKDEREMVRKMMVNDEFIEIFIDTPIEIAEQRDVKGLYAKARLGKIKNFTGISSEYQAPEKPDIHINTVHCSVETAAEDIFIIIEKLIRA